MHLRMYEPWHMEIYFKWLKMYISHNYSSVKGVAPTDKTTGNYPLTLQTPSALQSILVSFSLLIVLVVWPTSVWI